MDPEQTARLDEGDRRFAVIESALTRIEKGQEEVKVALVGTLEKPGALHVLRSAQANHQRRIGVLESWRKSTSRRILWVVCSLGLLVASGIIAKALAAILG